MMKFTYKHVTYVRTDDAIELQSSGAKEIRLPLLVANCLANAVRISAVLGSVTVEVEEWLSVVVPAGRSQVWLSVNDERIIINLKADEFATLIELMIASEAA